MSNVHFFWIKHRRGWRVVFNANKLAKLVKQKNNKQNWLDYYRLKYSRNQSKRPMMKTRLFGLCGNKVDAIDYQTAEVERLSKEIAEERERVKNDPKSIMPAAFVSFKTRWGAAVCAQTQQSRNPTLWLTEWAPEPRDVYWKNLAIPYVYLTIRRLIIGVAFFFLTFFFMIPITFVQTLASIEGIRKRAPFLKVIIDIPFIKSFIQGFLPGIALKIFLIVLPTILMLMSKFEGWESISALERRSASKYYIFNFVNVFLGSIIAGAAFDQLNTFIHQSANESGLWSIQLICANEFKRSRNGLGMKLLNQSNYKVWKTCMESYLVGEDLWNIVNRSNTSPPIDGPKNDGAYKKWKQTNAKAEFILKRTVSSRLFDHIIRCKLAHEKWRTFDQLFNKKNEDRLQILENELANANQAESRAIDALAFINLERDWIRYNAIHYVKKKVIDKKQDDTEDVQTRDVVATIEKFKEGDPEINNKSLNVKDIAIEPKQFTEELGKEVGGESFDGYEVSKEINGQIISNSNEVADTDEISSYHRVVLEGESTIPITTAFHEIIRDQHDLKIPKTIGVAIPIKATFFITYIMVDGWAGIAGEILRLKPLIIFHLKNFFLVKTERDREKAMDPGSLDFNTGEPQIQLYFLLGLVYAVVTPFLLPFILVFFGMAYFVFRHQSLKDHWTSCPSQYKIAQNSTCKFVIQDDKTVQKERVSCTVSCTSKDLVSRSLAAHYQNYI
ncbi:Protein OSCA1 [Capsicum annuum]|nr:Protein OSCA1 [Capsicum annuum]